MRLGQHEYDAIGLEFPLRDVTPPDEDAVAAARDIFGARGLTVT